MKRTLLMIKPDAVSKGVIGRILFMLEENGFKIVAIRSKRFSRNEAERFYEVHRERPFFEDLVNFITEGTVVGVMVEHEDAVRRLRDLVGATDPKEARPGTIRAIFGESIERNAVHASDSPESARRELNFFFHEDSSD
ncbi:MAG: nucleoside-diphosphate kinase [Thermotogae bacterium]|nr:nucleoside-diphosphate kinase [Thermotogota bacterium]